jgi:hypothetical protein
VLTLPRSIDPEMDQKLCLLGCMLPMDSNCMIIGIRRPRWMDGSDSDDENKNSCSSVRKEAEN